MSETIFRVVADVPSSQLTTVLGVIEGAAQLVEVRPCDPVSGGKKRPAGPRYMNGKRNKGISARDMVLEVLGRHKRPVSPDELGKVFVARGFSANSASPAVSALVAEKKIERGDNGYLSLKKGK